MTPAFDDRNRAIFGADHMWWPALVCWTILFVGCGPRLPVTHPVSGRLTLDGQPLANATIIFDPKSERPIAQRHAGRTRSHADGTYTLSTFREGDGAAVGRYAVAVLPAQPLVSDAPPDAAVARSSGMVQAFPERYLSPATSGIVMDVEPTANVIDITLTTSPTP